MSRERRTVRSIEIGSPIEVKFLDQQEHDIVLRAERHALQEVVDRTGQQASSMLSDLPDKSDDNTVELLETVEEDSDQRVRRKVETKRVVAEDPSTRSRITKVTKTETTEVTKVYTIKTDEDVRRAALELGVSDMSLILSEDAGGRGGISLWTAQKPRFESEVLTPPCFAPQGDFVLVGTEGTPTQRSQQTSRQSLRSQKKGKAEPGRLASLCSCTRKKRDVSKGAHQFERGRREDETFGKKEPAVSIRKRIQESARRMSVPAVQQLASDSAKFVIKQQNLQLGTYIFDLMCKTGHYQSDAEKDRGRKVISRALDLLYYDRCQSWPEFHNQLWLENEEYTSTNHVVSPTTHVIEYIFTHQPDLITFIDSLPDGDLLGQIKNIADEHSGRVPTVTARDTSEKISDIYHPAKKKLSIAGRASPPVGEHPEVEGSLENPAGYILSIIHDHERLSPKEERLQLKKMGGHVSAGLPDVVVSPEYSPKAGETPTTRRRMHEKAAGPSRPCYPAKCFSCFGESRKDRYPAPAAAGREKAVSEPVTYQKTQKIDAPAVQWPTIGVGQVAYDAPDIILVDGQKYFEKISQPSLQISPPIERIRVDATRAGPISVEASTKFEEKRDASRPIAAESETIIRPMPRPTDDDDYVKIKLAETVDIVAKGALSAAEKHADDQCFVAIGKTTDELTERPYVPELTHIRGIIDSHKRIPAEPIGGYTAPVYAEDRRPRLQLEPPGYDVGRVSKIISDHRDFPPSPITYRFQPPDNIIQIIRYHRDLPSMQQLRMAPIGGHEKVEVRKGGTGLSCTRCFSSKPHGRKPPKPTEKKRTAKETKDLPDVVRFEEPVQLAKVIHSATELPEREHRPRTAKHPKTPIEAPLFRLPDIKLGGGRNIFIVNPAYLDQLKARLNEVFPGQNADQLLNDIIKEADDEPLERLRSTLATRYPVAMIDLVLLSMSNVQVDYDAGVTSSSEVPSALVRTFDKYRPMYMQQGQPLFVSQATADTQTMEGKPQIFFAPATKTKRGPSKCFPCSSEKKITIPMSPDCIELLDSLQRLPSSHLNDLGTLISNRMRLRWRLDKADSAETSRVVKKILARLRDAQVPSLAVLRNELKDESPKYFYVVDPCVDVIQVLCSAHDLSQCSMPIDVTEIDRILAEVEKNYAGTGLLSNSSLQPRTAWVIRPEAVPDMVQVTERRITGFDVDGSICRKRRKLTKIIQDAFDILARRQVSNTYDLRCQLHRLYPKDCGLVDLVVNDIEEGITSGRLFSKCGRASVRILINILHSQDVESCRIQDGPNERMLSDRAVGNLQRNRASLMSSVRALINEPQSNSLSNVQKIREDEDIDYVIGAALSQLEVVKSFEELTESLKSHVKHESTAKLLSMLLEQAYFVNELEDPASADAIGLMRDRLHGKPLVLREICFALPDHTTIQCGERGQDHYGTSGPGGRLINVGQGLTWREANERARILFYRGKKPAVRYNDVLDGFDVRMLLEQDGCVHEIPVSPDDVKKLLNSCGLYWDGLNISLLGKSDEILHRAEQEAFKILRETGFLRKTENGEGESRPTESS